MSYINNLEKIIHFFFFPFFSIQIWIVRDWYFKCHNLRINYNYLPFKDV